MEHYKYVSEAVQLVSRSWYETQTFCVSLHVCTIHFVLSTSLAECWFRQDLCPLSIVLICQARLGKEVVLTGLMDPFGLFPLSCSFGWDMPLKVMSLPFPSVKGWEICVRKWEDALKWCFSLHHHTLPHAISFFWANLPGRFSAVTASFVKDAARRQEYNSKSIFAGQGCCQRWGSSLLLMKAPGWWRKCWLRSCHSISTLGVVGRVALAIRIGENGSDSGLYSKLSQPWTVGSNRSKGREVQG